MTIRKYKWIMFKIRVLSTLMSLSSNMVNRIHSYQINRGWIDGKEPSPTSESLISNVTHRDRMNAFK